MYGASYRPDWHKDAKWLVGLLLVATLALAVFFFSLAQMTRQAPGQDMLASVLALSLTPEALAGPNDAGGASVVTLEQAAAMIYAEGRQASLVIMPDALAARRLEAALGPFEVFTLPQHRRFVRLAWLLGLASLLLLFALLYFSAERSRLLNAGTAFVFASLLGVAILLPLNGALQAAPVSAPPESLQADGAVAYLLGLLAYVRSSLPLGALETALWNHVAVLTLGASLIALFFYLRLRQRYRPRRRYIWFR